MSEKTNTAALLRRRAEEIMRYVSNPHLASGSERIIADSAKAAEGLRDIVNFLETQ